MKFPQKQPLKGVFNKQVLKQFECSQEKHLMENF